MAFQAPPAPRSSGHLVFVRPDRCRETHATALLVVLTSLLATWLIGSPITHAAESPAETGQGGKSENGSSAPPPAISVSGMASELEFIKEEESAVIAGGLYPGKPQPISKASSNVYVITDDDIRHSGAIDLPTILRRVPGIDVMQVTAADFNVSARGDNQLRANKMLVLVDGRSVYLDMQGEVLWKNIPVTLPEIKQIEVLKGPAAALYGFNAFDGVINIITKSAAEMKGVTVQFGGGEFGTISSAAVVAGVQGKFGYRLSAGHNQTNQWNNRNSLAFRNNLVNGQLEYALSRDSKVILQGGLVDSNNYDGPIVDNTDVEQKPSQRYVNAVYDRPNFFIRAFWTGTMQPGTIDVNPLVASVFRITDRNGNPNINLNENSYNVESQHAIDFGAANRLTYGVNYRHNTAQSNYLDGYAREDRLGLYLQDEWRVAPSLTAVAGVRYDLDTFINPTISPRFTLQWNPAENHSFRAGASVGYRPPTIFETRLFNLGVIDIPGPIPPITTSAFGSSQLAPEQIISYDAGYQGWFWKHRLRVRGDLFYNHISDLISIASTAPGATTNSFFNGGSQGPGGTQPGSAGGGSADIYGGEAGVEAQMTQWLSGFANYTYQEIHQTYRAGNRVGRGAPRFKANAGLRAEFDNGMSGEGLLHYVGSTTYSVDSSFAAFAAPPFFAGPAPNPRVGSYVLLNLRGAYKFWREQATAGHRREAEFAFTVFNALNDKHKEHPLGETIGSRVMGWLTIKY